MTSRFVAGACRLGFTTVAAIAFTASLLAPSSAGMRDRMKDKVVAGVADDMVSTIQSDSCPEFAAMMQSHKSGGDSDKSSKMKNDPATRQKFVDKVAGPLLNKMIDCDMLPSK